MQMFDFFDVLTAWRATFFLLTLLTLFIFGITSPPSVAIHDNRNLIRGSNFPPPQALSCFPSLTFGSSLVVLHGAMSSWKERKRPLERLIQPPPSLLCCPSSPSLILVWQDCDHMPRISLEQEHGESFSPVSVCPWHCRASPTLSIMLMTERFCGILPTSPVSTRYSSSQTSSPSSSSLRLPSTC